jgi:hypothetical protein
MASRRQMRQTLLALLGWWMTVLTRRVISAVDCRLSGCFVCETNSQAVAFTVAWSKGGKARLASAARLIIE